jgi:KilA-N domain
LRKTKNSTIDVQGTIVTVNRQSGDDYISLTDIAKHKEPDRSDIVIQNWMRNRNTVEFLGIWERLNNAVLNPSNSRGLKIEPGLTALS